MNKWLSVIAVLLLAQSVAAWAQPATPTQFQSLPADLSEPDRAAIRAVIEDQMAAFQRDDGGAAFSHASPAIQAQFGTPENFMRMVRQGYQPVYRPRQVEFLDLVVARGELVQRVFVVGPDGLDVIALYLMQRQLEGQWKINGCVLVRPEGRRT
ncbi:MAG: DUF4864 domain-containing protein [Nitrospinota bacterium]